MSFWNDVKNTQKSPEDHKRDLAEIVRALPGVRETLEWFKCGVEKFNVEQDGKKFTAIGDIETITIWIEDKQYRIEYSDVMGVSEERRYDGKSKVETERISNHLNGDIVRCVRDRNFLEKVDVYRPDSNGEMIRCGTRDIAAPLGSISEGMEFDIATLDACGGLRFCVPKDKDKGCYQRYRDCKAFTKRNMGLVKQAVAKSNYPDQCCQYDETVQEMNEKSQ